MAKSCARTSAACVSFTRMPATSASKGDMRRSSRIISIVVNMLRLGRKQDAGMFNVMHD